MLKLMKYEFRKTAFSKMILLVITALFELFFLAGVFLKKDDLTAIGIAMLAVCATVGVVYIGLESVMMLQRELNSKQSYMLFLMPKSSYEILGAKILENGISILLTGVCFALLAVLDVTVATLYIGGVKELMNMVQSVLHMGIDVMLEPKYILFGFFSTLASWIIYIVNADLAVILSASVLAGKKASGLVSFLIFLLLSGVLGWGMDRIPSFQNAELDFILYIAVAFVVSLLLYLVSGWIMEKKLSV